MSEPKKPRDESVRDLLSAPGEGDSPDPKDDVIADLEQKVLTLENKLGEYKFLAAVVAAILFNAIALVEANNFAAPLVIGVLQLIGLVVWADRCKVDVIIPLLDKFTGMLRRH